MCLYKAGAYGAIKAEEGKLSNTHFVLKLNLFTFKLLGFQRASLPFFLLPISDFKCFRQFFVLTLNKLKISRIYIYEFPKIF